MSGTMQRLKDEIAAALAVAETHMRKAQDEDQRELTADERAEIDAALVKARELKARLGRYEDLDRVNAELAELRLAAAPAASSAIVPMSGGRPKSLGQQWTESAAYDFFRQGLHRRGMAWTSPAVDLVAATLTSDPASGGALLPVQSVGGGIIPLPTTIPRVALLFAQGTTESGMLSWLVETAATNAAAAVAEGGLKPESALTFDAEQKALAKVATWLPVSEEMLSDVPQMRSYIDARLMLFVAIKMDDQVLNGNGTAPNMLGILNTPGLSGPVAAGATESNADALFRAAMTALATSNLMPDGIVLNPADWAGTVLAKDDTGRYLGAGAYAAIPAPAIWGIRTVPTPAIAQGTGLVGAFAQGGQFWKKDEITVQASNSHADFFVKNLVAIRAEQRALLTTYRPQAFAKVTGLDSGLVAPTGANGGGELAAGKRK
jgi:HK97 family phage major capsid protein